MRKIDLELIVGMFVLIGIIALGYISIKLGKMEWVGGGGYEITAAFPRVGGLKVGALVEISGVEVGRVRSIILDEEYKAVAVLEVYKEVALDDESIASIKTKGLLGEKYVDIEPGGGDMIGEGGKIHLTEEPIDLESLLKKLIGGDIEKAGDNKV